MLAEQLARNVRRGPTPWYLLALAFLPIGLFFIEVGFSQTDTLHSTAFGLGEATFWIIICVVVARIREFPNTVKAAIIIVAVATSYYIVLPPMFTARQHVRCQANEWHDLYSTHGHCGFRVTMPGQAWRRPLHVNGERQWRAAR